MTNHTSRAWMPLRATSELSVVLAIACVRVAQRPQLCRRLGGEGVATQALRCACLTGDSRVQGLGDPAVLDERLPERGGVSVAAPAAGEQATAFTYRAAGRCKRTERSGFLAWRHEHSADRREGITMSWSSRCGARPVHRTPPRRRQGAHPARQPVTDGTVPVPYRSGGACPSGEAKNFADAES